MTLRVLSLFARRLSLSLGATIAFVAVNVLLIAACLVALRQNVSLRRQIGYDLSLLTPAKGTLVPPLAGEDWRGTQQAIAYEQDRRPTLVYMFSTGCGYCKENWRAMRAFQDLAPRWLRIVYIDTFEDRFSPKFLAESGIGQSPLLVRLSSLEQAVAFDARAVPQLVLIDHDGHVQWSHVGELARRDISQALSLIEHD